MAKLFNKTVRTPPPRRFNDFLWRIRDPVNYQMGLKKPDLDLPDSIVQFVRRQGFRMPNPQTNVMQCVLILNLKGSGDVVMDRERIHLFPYHALLIFPGQLHRYENMDSRSLTWFHIGFRTGQPEALAALRNRSVPISAQAWQYGECLARDYMDPERTSFHFAGRISVMLWLLLMELVKAHRLRIPAIPVPPEPNLMRVDKLRSHIEQHIDTALHLPDLAKHMNMSLSSLKDFSRKNLDVGLARFVRMQRIYFACGMMSATNLTMTEIAARCGFTSIYAFSRTFKRMMAISPTAHRAKLQAAAYPRCRVRH
jgi:AraC-like DNA-binding protein